ncbi:TolC family protein [Panacibacter sp. DH6]|uniref:TolC family protein n=1 Tax=Panacibacter microcysteis TaxID=2793269 RepID=A0A931MCH6_9BACT|nr:TolC family protein [Panacibacter microcysteis]MBG9378095.1 TolC family protein [Panacibacter microcysteis]
MKRWLLYIVLFVAQSVTAQSLFTVDEFIQQVRQYHPVAKQANILVDQAAAELLAAKGAFDPAVMLDASRKTFDGKNYYYYTNPELKLPTWVGIDVKAGLESNGGTYLNPEVTSGNTSYLGVEVPLAKGLLMDKRRAAVQQARILRSQSEQERMAAINDLLFDAYTSYWQWAGQYSLYNLYSTFLDVSNKRFRLVKLSFVNGDRSAMDTLEAFAQLQNVAMMQTEALAKLNDAVLDLSNYLWIDRDSAYLLPSTAKPDTVRFAAYAEPVDAEAVIANAYLQHPLLRTYQFKLESLQVERKLKFQSLLPVLNAKANLLNKNYYVLKGVDAAFLQNNYKWGIDFKLPLFLREGRGSYQQAKLKIENTNYAFTAKQWEIENKIRSYFNQFIQLQKQLQITQSAFDSYRLLLRQEELRFANGESSLFVINSRENKVIETGQKLAELRIKYQKAYYAVQWAAGMLR